MPFTNPENKVLFLAKQVKKREKDYQFIKDPQRKLIRVVID